MAWPFARYRKKIEGTFCARTQPAKNSMSDTSQFAANNNVIQSTGIRYRSSAFTSAYTKEKAKLATSNTTDILQFLRIAITNPGIDNAVSTHIA